VTGQPHLTLHLTLSLFIALTYFYFYLTYSLLLLTSSASDFFSILTFSRPSLIRQSVEDGGICFLSYLYFCLHQYVLHLHRLLVHNCRSDCNSMFILAKISCLFRVSAIFHTSSWSLLSIQ
jgi:hypothetical protein